MRADTDSAKKYVIFFASPFNVPTPPPGWHEVARHIWHKPDARARTTYELVIVWSRDYKRQRCRVITVPLLNLQSLKDWQPQHKQHSTSSSKYKAKQSPMVTSEGDYIAVSAECFVCYECSKVQLYRLKQESLRRLEG